MAKRKDYQWLLFAFRCIGDALVYEHFDKWTLKPLALRESPGRSSGKRGLRQENAVLRALLEQGTPAVRTDLTNLIRYADIIHPRQGGSPAFIEVKSSLRLDGRSRRQLKRIRDVASFLEHDVAEDLFGLGCRVRRRALHAPETSHEQSMNDAIRDARSSGMAFRRPEPGLTLLAVRKHSDTVMAEAFTEPQEAHFFSLNKYKSDAKWTWRPFTLSIHDTQDLADFVFGDLSIFVVVEKIAMRKIAEQAGWDLIAAESEEYMFGVRHQTDPEARCFASKHFAARVATEFVSLKWAVEELIHKGTLAKEGGLGEP